MFDLIAITALAVSAICAVGSSLWAWKVYKGKRDERGAGQSSDTTSLHLPKNNVGQPKEASEGNPMEAEIDIESFHEHAGSFVPEDVRDQIIAAAESWPRVTPAVLTEEWRKAVEESLALVERLRVEQETLGLDAPHLDYRELSPEDVDKLFRSTERHRALT